MQPDYTLVGDLLKVRRLIDQVAPTSATVMLRGETGTGKEVVARKIHKDSPRKEKPFIVVNCGGIVESLLESYLFGHTAGAFTGATKDQLGKFKLAEGGTIFLDEIGDMSPNLQIKLFRVLDCGEYERVGEGTPGTVDTRVIAGTNRPLEKMMEAGTFRDDLYHRLNIFPIHLPPLRRRMKDIEKLTAHFVQYFGRKHYGGFDNVEVFIGEERYGRDDTPNFTFYVEPEVVEKLGKYNWPGNVRELRNIIEKGVILSDRDKKTLTANEIDVAVLDGKNLSMQGDNGQINTIGDAADLFCSYLEDAGGGLPMAEKLIIKSTLISVQGSRTKASILLGIGERTLYRKINEYGLRDVNHNSDQHANDPPTS
jgi:transcriptional regulator with PAS, ATPase and Fis domain|tara:strand:- start:3043 stop:4146 length:1104 start_codon:yes stop_codon:yes gene_type:complete